MAVLSGCIVYSGGPDRLSDQEVKMKVNDILHGFKVTRVRESEELKGTLYEMEHIRTGAVLAWLDNGCDNKLFSATFKTIPWDDTGVFHILEHSVLAGSDNYPCE